MDPLYHPYCKKHLLKQIKHMLYHINDKLKPAKKYTYNTYYRHPEQIMEALDKCQEMDDYERAGGVVLRRMEEQDALRQRVLRAQEEAAQRRSLMTAIEAAGEAKEDAQALMRLPTDFLTKKPYLIEQQEERLKYEQMGNLEEQFDGINEYMDGKRRKPHYIDL